MALREDLLANAVGFLQHPRVVGSQEADKRAFLERKGLTEAEIAEAFRRAPAASPAPHFQPAPVAQLQQQQLALQQRVTWSQARP